MLILAGVSLNAIIGDNGLITQTQYASFLQEMTSVQEAVDTWKAGRTIDNAGELTNKIPVKRMVTQEELTNSSRLTGEVGYYRVWSLTGKRPTQNVSLSVSEFDSEFSGEIISYPAGIQDLYVLNNEILDLDEDKVYYIDAVNSMIYSANGFAISGVSAHSLNMLNAIMNGSEKKPKFASAEVSGGGSSGGQILAGNTAPEYLMNENGEYVDEEGEVVTEENKVENPNYSPNGFRIIADVTNDNIYKLYNNGDLYAKGKKGIPLNNSNEELEELNPYKYLTENIPSTIPGVSSGDIKIILGYKIIYVIDSNKNVWAWGENTNNRMGLSSDEQIEFSPLQPRKLKINGEKATKIFAPNWATFIVTESGHLYGAGSNCFGALGINYRSEQTDKMELISFPEDPNNIKEIFNQADGNRDSADGFSFILTTTGNLYFAGRHCNEKGENVILENIDSSINTNYILTWTKVNTDEMFPDLDFLNVKGTGSSGRWHNSYWLFYNDTICYEMIWNGNTRKITEWGDKITNIEAYTGYTSVSPILVKVVKKTGIEWCYRGANSYSSIFSASGEAESWNNITDKMSAVETTSKKIQEIWLSNNAMVVKLSNGECFGIGSKSTIGLGDFGRVDTWTKIKALSDISINYTLPKPALPLLINLNNTSLMGVGCVDIIKREKTLQQSWKKIATDVKDFNAQTDGNTFAVLKKDGFLYIRGLNSNFLGLNIADKEISELTKITGEGAENDVKNALQTGIKSYNLSGSTLYILTNSGKLICSTSGNSYSGLNDGNTPHIKLVKVLDNIEYFYCYSEVRIAYSSVDGALFWGPCDSSGYGHPNCSRPTKLDVVWNSVGKWKNVSIGRGIWLCAENGVVTSGINRNDGFTNGTGNSVENGAILATSEKIINICFNGGFIILGKSGKLYGAGLGACIGDGTGNLGKVNNVLHTLGCDINFCDVVGGNGFAVATTKDGKVYATGTNVFGTLGRWVGVERGESNSRYRTSYSWVECPELEI